MSSTLTQSARRLFQRLPLSRRTRLRMLELTYRFGGFLFSRLPNYQRWQLARQHPRAVSSRRKNSSCGEGQRTILVVDTYIPRPDRDTGSRLMVDYMSSLQRLGFHVVFIPFWSWWDPTYGLALEAQGVEVLTDGEAIDLEQLLTARADEIAMVWLSRPEIAHGLMEGIRGAWSGPVVYLGHDIYHQRLARQRAVVSQRQVSLGEIEAMRAIEEQCWQQADFVVYPSLRDVETVNAFCRDSRACVVPVGIYCRAATEGAGLPATDGRGREIVFVGNFAHQPNVDGLQWFHQRCLPLIRQRVAQARLTVVGRDCPLTDEECQQQETTAVGSLSDDELHMQYRRARLAIVPLRFGGGVKGKVLEAMGRGIPVVATSCGAEGVAGLDTVVAVADEDEQFAAEVSRLLQDDAYWRERSEAGLRFVSQHFSMPSFDEAMEAVVKRGAGQ